MATIEHTEVSFPINASTIPKVIELAGAEGVFKYACLGVYRGDNFFLTTQRLEVNAVNVTGNSSPIVEAVGYDPYDVTQYGEYRKGFEQNSQTCMNLLRDLTIAVSDSLTQWNTTVSPSTILSGATNHPDGYFDFVWMDLPDKSQSTMDAAFNAWMPKVRSGGVIGGVQYTDSISYSQHTAACGVKASVDAQVAAQGTDLHVYTNAGNQWLFTKS